MPSSRSNISAILDQLGLPYIRGYKPRSNFKDLLREVVLAHVQREQPVLQSIVDAIEKQTEPGNKSYRGVLIEPPVSDGDTITVPDSSNEQHKIRQAGTGRRQAVQ